MRRFKGSYEFDLAAIYEMEKHELYRKWVALIDKSGKFQGIQVCFGIVFFFFFVFIILFRISVSTHFLGAGLLETLNYCSRTKGCRT
jgi:hypothetical protein